MIPCPTPRLLAHLALRRRAIQDVGVFLSFFGTLSPHGPGDPRYCWGSPVQVSGRGRACECTPSARPPAPPSVQRTPTGPAATVGASARPRGPRKGTVGSGSSSAAVVARPVRPGAHASRQRDITRWGQPQPLQALLQDRSPVGQVRANLQDAEFPPRLIEAP